MARAIASLPAGSRITDYISLGVIAKFFPAEKVHEILKETNRASIRERDLPAHVVVYSVIALALYMRSIRRSTGRWRASRAFLKPAAAWVPNRSRSCMRRS